MNFEKIELIGFKSFADKMTITFDNGVTAIVGPNGCGKSNIADAIRWVLGEQSAKSLRGGTMTDVIFNGTQNRKSLSYCEVSLYFDNSQHIFKSCDYSEVIMTRKLFRSGESEYYINKQPARMRDIIDLLHECGVSKNGYSIIGQGKVSEILSSKPEDRRAIFEEAVGIAKTKQSKLETERKLQRTRDNIVRVSDLTSEVERQLEPAERAANKTRTYLEVASQLKYHEINNFLFKRENASVIIDKINLRIQGLIEETEINEQELATAVESYNEHMRELAESDREITALHDEILEKSVSLEQVNGQTKLYREKISYLKGEIERLNADEAEQLKKRESLLAAVESKKKYLAECDDELTKLSEENESILNRLEKVLKEISDGENMSESTQSEMLKTAETLAGLSKTIGLLDAEKSAMDSKQRETIEKVEALTSSVSVLATEKQRTEAEIIANEKLQTELKEKIEKKEKEISEKNNVISDLANKIYKLNIEINNIKSNISIYSKIKESFEGYPAAVKKLMADAKNDPRLKEKIKGVVATVIQTDKAYEVAIETSIGNALQNLITATPEDAQYIIEYLKRVEGGRVTILPISSVRPHRDCPEIFSALKEKGAVSLASKLVRFEPVFQSIVDHLLGNTLIVDNSANALYISKKYRFNFRIVTLEGDVFSSSGTVSGGSRRTSSSNLMSTGRMLETLEASLTEKNGVLSKLSGEKEKSTEQSNSLVDGLDRLNSELQTARQESSSLKERKASVEARLNEKQAELEDNKEVVESVIGRLQEIAKEYSDIEQGNKELAEKKASASSENAKLRQRYDELKSKRDKLIEQNTANKTRISFLTAELKAGESDVTRMTEDAAAAQAQAEKDRIDAEDDRKTIDIFIKEIEKLTFANEEATGVGNLKTRLKALEERKGFLNRTIAQDDLKKQMVNAELTKLAEKKHDEELSITKVKSELEYIETRVQEEYNLTYDECKDKRDPEYDISSSNQEISRLKHRISALGNVNPGAIEEYQVLKERYDEYRVQRDDLDKAEQDLKDVIKRLTDEMLTTFNAGFEEIRGHFKQIFKELFGGGSADLILDYTDVEDPLDAGVEIVAEPPGKKLQKISLLSGGEMSLTAIAILFAILKLRPMPFCVLDEIEAALDDANVERFARYLKHFSSETQFVVITHKKVTMELSDALFGVTMQEKGVSKIVSVKLSEIKDTLGEDIQ